MSKRKKQTVPSKKTQVSNNYAGKLSLVVPCFNEGNRLGDLFSKLQRFHSDWTGNFEVILVNDGSTDDTLEKLQTKGDAFSVATGVSVAIVDLETNKGKGAALKAGVQRATGDHILTLDADMATSPQELLSWIPLLPGNTFPEDEILIASREHEESKVEGKFIRRFAGLIFNFIIQLFTNLNVKDTQCGFKLYPGSIAHDLFARLKTTGWAHDVELLYLAKLQRVSIQEMPVVWNHQDGSKISLLKDSIRMLLQVMRISGMLNWQYFFVEPLTTFGKNQKTGDESPIFRLLFVGAVMLLLVLMPLLSFDYGLTGDEEVQRIYGEKVLAFYETNGEDASALDYKNLYLYGGLFDYTAAWLNKYIGGLDQYAMRHVLNAFTGFLLFLFAGLLGKEISGSWRVGFLSLLFVVLSPRIFGHSMNNPKDIPFAAAYAFTLLYLIRFLRELPRPGLKTVFFLIIGIAASINIRVGGILLIAYFGLFSGLIYLWRGDLRSELVKIKGWVRAISLVLLVCIAGYFGGLLYWPFGQQDPLSNPFRSLSEMSNFSTSIKMLFEGRHLWSDELPWYYILKWMAIGSPLYLLAGVLLFPVFLFVRRRSPEAIYLLFVAFTAIFPVVYAVIQGSSLYDGMRHFLFVIPVLAVLGAWAWDRLINLRLPNAYFSYGLSGLLTVGLVLPLLSMFRNHPYQSVYFNEAFGGAKAAYGHYEMDYWMNSMKEMCEWLVENDPDIRAGKEKTILTSSMDPVSYYMRQLAPNVKVEYVRYTDRHAKAGDYFFFFNRFVDRGLLLSGAWPPGELVYEVKVDDTPIAAITRTEPNGFSVKGKASATQQDTDGAIQWYAQAVAVDPKDELAWNGLAQAYLDRQRWAEAKQALDQLFMLSDSEFGTWYLLGQYHYNQGQVEEAKKAFEMCKSLNYKQNLTYYFLAAIAGNQNDPAAVVRHIEDYDRNGGNLGQVFDLGIAAAGQLSLPAPARYFEAKKALFSGDTQRAFQLMGEALARDPNYQPALLLRNQFQAN